MTFHMQKNKFKAINSFYRSLSWVDMEYSDIAKHRLSISNVKLLQTIFCLKPINFRTAEPIWPKLVVESHMTSGNVKGWLDLKNMP